MSIGGMSGEALRQTYLMTAEATAAFVTVVSRNHLAYARALAHSIREHEPQAQIFACLIDRPPKEFDAAAEPFTTLYADELGIADWRRLAFQYDPFELCCAVKLIAAGYLLETEGFERVIYLDGDMLVCASVASILSRLDDADIVLTPHLHGPLPLDGLRPSELTIRRAGTFNAGQIALRRSAGARALVAWWRTKVPRLCVMDVSRGLFADQGWLDLVPGLFDRVGVDRTPGHNAAYWNIQGCRIERTPDGGVRIDGEPLVTFHFTGFDPERPDQLSVHGNRVHLADYPVLAELARGYARRLQASGHAVCAAWGYGYATLSDGTPIDPLWREAMREEDPALAGVGDPFDVHVAPDLVARYRATEAAARQAPQPPPVRKVRVRPLERVRRWVGWILPE